MLVLDIICKKFNILINSKGNTVFLDTKLNGINTTNIFYAFKPNMEKNNVSKTINIINLFIIVLM